MCYPCPLQTAVGLFRLYLYVLLLLVLLQIWAGNWFLTHITQGDVSPAVDLMSGEIRLWDIVLTRKDWEDILLSLQITWVEGGRADEFIFGILVHKNVRNGAECHLGDIFKLHIWPEQKSIDQSINLLTASSPQELPIRYSPVATEQSTFFCHGFTWGQSAVLIQDTNQLGKHASNWHQLALFRWQLLMNVPVWCTG